MQLLLTAVSWCANEKPTLPKPEALELLLKLPGVDVNVPDGAGSTTVGHVCLNVAKHPAELMAPMMVVLVKYGADLKKPQVRDV